MEYDKKYKVYSWKHPFMLHWILNPGLAISELIFGQRVPKVSLEDMSGDKPRIERSYVPCPHCEEIHDARTWSVQNKTAFKNWFGMYCPNCGEIIPCLLNVFSFLVLVLTFPIWFWFKESMKQNWLSKQAARYQNLKFEKMQNPYENGGWIKSGLGWGIFMFVFMSFLMPLFMGEEISALKVGINFPIMLLGGLGFGYTMKKWMGSKFITGENVEVAE